VLVLVYAVAAPILWANRDFVDDGPLALNQPALEQPLPGGIPLAQVSERCLAQDGFSDDPTYRLKIVGGEVGGVAYYACYQSKPDGAVWQAEILDTDGFPVSSPAIAKQGGAWRWIGTVKSVTELILGGLGVAVAAAAYWIYYRRPRPGPDPTPRWWQSRTIDGVLIAFPLVGWAALLMLPGRSRPRRVRLAMMIVLIWSGVLAFSLMSNVAEHPDRIGFVVVSFLIAAILYGWLAGRRLVAADGFAAAEGAFVESPPRVRWADPAPNLVGVGPSPAASVPVAVSSGPAVASTSAPPPQFRVQAPDQLPSFTDVGGMTELKKELSDTFGLLLAFAGEADAYRITFNGVLLHGPPGVGKTFIARAVAGEFGLNFVHVSVGDLSSKYVGDAARNIQAVFRFAASQVPCVLFFDEFDSVAGRREDDPNQESRRTVNQLLQSLEEFRAIPELIVVAATNHLEQLDTAVVRPGRFDRHVRISLPDLDARQAILAAQLDERPTEPGLDLTDVARRTENLTPAAITQVVQAAALAAFRETTATGALTRISTAHLLGALQARGGKDRPTVEDWTWDRLVLAPGVKVELQQTQRMIEDPDVARSYGVRPPTGLLLAGPPGTGKTTIARVLAAEARCSFYAVTSADVTSKWVGESEQNVARLFTRARDNAPSIIFLDEIDAIGGRRTDGQHGAYDRQLTQLLAEMDGLAGRRGVFVVGATNRPDQLDPALTRGGRLSRTIWIPLPDQSAREQLLRLFTREMPLASLDFPGLAAATEGLSGADLEALCQQAAVAAMVRATSGEAASQMPSAPHITEVDFATALQTIRGAKDRNPTPHGQE